MSNHEWVAYQKLTDAGRNPRKQTNEDSVEAYCPDDEQLVERRGVLLIVADGIGGQAHGEIASSMAIEETVERYYGEAPDIASRDALVEAMKQANAAVLLKAQSDPQYDGMGTTMTAMALTPGGALLVANVGDSRGYIIRSGTATQVTVDHTWVAEQVRAKMLSPEEASTHRRRHQITRSMGRRPNIEVDTSQHQLLPGDRLLLCSDGLSDVASDAEIASGAMAPDLDDVVRDLVSLANSRGGPDNISVVAAHYIPKAVRHGSPNRRRNLLLLGLALLVVVAAISVSLILRMRRSSLTATPMASASPIAATEDSASQPRIEVSGKTATPNGQSIAEGERTVDPAKALPTATLAPKAVEAATAPPETAIASPASSGSITVLISGLDANAVQCGRLQLIDEEENVETIPMRSLYDPQRMTDGLFAADVALKGASRLKFLGSADGACPWDVYTILRPDGITETGVGVAANDAVRIEFSVKEVERKENKKDENSGEDVVTEEK